MKEYARMRRCIEALERSVGCRVNKVTPQHSSGISTHRVFLLDTEAEAIAMKLYGKTGHAAREREIMGYSSMASYGCPVPNVIWSSSSLDAIAGTYLMGVDATLALHTVGATAIGRAIGWNLARSAERGRVDKLGYLGSIPAPRFAEECFRYTSERCASVHGLDVRNHFHASLTAWIPTLTPSYPCGVNFDCKLEHFLFSGTDLIGMIDFEHWDIFDPAVDVGDLLHSLMESVEDRALRRCFCRGFVAGLGDLYDEVVERLPFYIGRRYLVKKSTISTTSGIVSAATFWFGQRFSTRSSDSELLAAVEAAPVLESLAR